jgi:hypothetical protein
MKLKSVLAVAAALTLAGCGDDVPEGPGTLDGSVEIGATDIGAIVVSVSGVGIGEIRGVGNTRAFASDNVASSKRVVLVTEQSGNLSFTIHVDDRSAPTPVATVVEAVDLNNQPVALLGDIVVRVGIQ